MSISFRKTNLVFCDDLWLLLRSYFGFRNLLQGAGPQFPVNRAFFKVFSKYFFKIFNLRETSPRVRVGVERLHRRRLEVQDLRGAAHVHFHRRALQAAGLA